MMGVATEKSSSFETFFEQFSNEFLDLNEINAKLPSLNKSLELCQNRVSSFLTCMQENVAEQPKKNQNHVERVSTSKNELKSIEKSIENALKHDLIEAEESYENSVREYNEINECISIVHIICEIHERIETLRNLRCNSDEYEIFVDLIDVLKILIQSLECGNVELVKSLEEIVQKEIELTLELLLEKFQESCIFLEESHRICLEIKRDSVNLEGLFKSLYKNSEICTKTVKIIADFVWEKIFLNIIESRCSLKIEGNHQFNAIYIEKFGRNDNIEILFENLSQIVTFLGNNLNFSLTENSSFLNYFSTELRNSSSNDALKEFVCKSIPNSWNLFEIYKEKIQNSISSLRVELEKYDFCIGNMNWVDNLNEFYLKTRTEYFHNKSVELMKKDLHNLIEIRTETIENFSISSYIPTLLNLAEELLEEIKEGSESNRRQLFGVYKGVFFNYADFVAKHHQKLLETIPQQVAVFYNNCNYLVEKYQKIDDSFENDTIFSEFSDETSKSFHEIGQIGHLYFTSFIDEQKKQILNIITGTNLQNRKSLDKLEENTEKLIRQCLRQQELLKTVWIKVLSHRTYNETIGGIFDAFIEFLVTSLVSMEDIQSEIAENLIEIFKIIQGRGPKLFTDPAEIYLVTSSWSRFNELNFVLGASLAEINDRWADGKGPLAEQFKGFELKQLIRALFQNTDRRSSVLARIH